MFSKLTPLFLLITPMLCNNNNMQNVQPKAPMTELEVIRNQFAPFVFVRILGVLTVSYIFNAVGISFAGYIYQFLTMNQSNKSTFLEAIFSRNSIVGLLTRVTIGFLFAFTGFTIFFVIFGLTVGDPRLQTATIYDIFDYVLTVPGVPPNVFRSVLVGVVQVVGWTLLATLGIARLSGPVKRRRRSLAPENLFPQNQNDWIFILNSLSKFD